MLDELWSICWYAALELLIFVFCFVVQLKTEQRVAKWFRVGTLLNAHSSIYIAKSLLPFLGKCLKERVRPVEVQYKVQTLSPSSGIVVQPNFGWSFCKYYHKYMGNLLFDLNF